MSFGSRFLDFDNDGLLDLVIANGHVQDNISQIDRATTYRQPTILLRNTGRTPLYFEDVSKKSPDLANPIVGRGGLRRATTTTTVASTFLRWIAKGSRNFFTTNQGTLIVGSGFGW